MKHHEYVRKYIAMVMVAAYLPHLRIKDTTSAYDRKESWYGPGNNHSIKFASWIETVLQPKMLIEERRNKLKGS